MKVVVGSDGWAGSRFRSAFTYSNAVLQAARAAGLEAQPYSLPQYYGARFGGLVRPWVRSLLGQYHVEPGTLVHQTTHGAWRGAHVSTVLDDYAFREEGGLPGRFRRSAVRMSVRRARRVVALSAAGAHDLGLTFPSYRDKFRWAPVAFEMPSASRLPTSYDALWIGAMGERKNPRAYLLLATQFASRRFAMRVHGEAAGLPIGPNVVLLPPQDDLETLYRSVPVLVVTSKFEGFHMPAMEAYLRGTNLVLPRMDPFVETYESDESKVFWYQPTGGVASLASAFERALGAPNGPPRAEIARAVSYDSVGRRLRGIYEEAAPR